MSQSTALAEDNSAAAKFQGSKWHAFFVGEVFQNMRIAFKPAVAVTITLAIGQNSRVAAIESSTMYLSAIFATLFMPNKTRIMTLELTLVAGIMIGLIAPFGMLAYLCARATRDPATDALQYAAYERAIAAGDSLGASPAVFYQGRPAAIAAVFVFVLAWVANVLKTIFVQYNFAFVASAIACGVFLLEGYLFPAWAQFYEVVKQVLYCAYIGLAVAFVVNMIIFPYNAREPYLVLTGKLLDLVGQMATQQAIHFSNTHVRLREVTSNHPYDESTSVSNRTEQESVEGKGLRHKIGQKKHKSEQKAAPDDLAQLQALRHALTAIAAAHQLAKAPAKREIAYGHMRSSELEAMHKHCRALLIPVLGCNLWSQVVEFIRSDRKNEAERTEEGISFLKSLGARTDLGAEEEESFFTIMEEQISPRIRALSDECSDAITHIKRVLHLGLYKRPPFYLRPFVASPTAISQEDMDFAARFESNIASFWAGKHASTAAFDALEDSRPHVSTLLIVYMESTLHEMSLELLKLVKWADEQRASGIMIKRRLIVPKPRRFTKPFTQTFARLSSHFRERHEHGDRRDSSALMVGRDESLEDDTYEPDAAQAFLVQPKSTLQPRASAVNRFFLFFYRLKLFIFDSKVSAFGFRAAVAMTAGALPAFFPDSVSVFLKYRLIWITFTVLLGLQPVLGRGLAAAFFRCIGTIFGGVVGLIAVEIGRVPAGILPVFFISVLPQFYLLQLDPKAYLIPVLLSVITQDLVVGYEVMVQKIGIPTVERSGQVYLAAPAVCGYRILLTLAGVVIVLIFCVCPGLPTAKTLLRDITAKRFYTLADTYMLYSIRAASERFDLPPAIDKAISQKQVESLAQSAMSQEFLSMTSFEPSIRGKFPKGDWSSLCVLTDNFATALAVSNALYTRIEDADQTLDVKKIGMHGERDELFRVISATLLALNAAVNAWQPLAPMLRSPVQAHNETQKRLMTYTSVVRQQRRNGTLSADLMTHYGAHTIANAIMARYLEDLMRQIGLMIGESGFKSYLNTHRKAPKAE